MKKHTIFLTSTEPEAEGLQSVVIDAAKCITLEEFYSNVAKSLNFPEYFRANPGSFTDLLEDYEDYGSYKDVLLIIQNAEHLLENEIYRYKILEDHAAIFNRVANYWGSDKDYDGSVKNKRKFRVCFLVSSSSTNETKWFVARMEQILASVKPQ